MTTNMTGSLDMNTLRPEDAPGLAWPKDAVFASLQGRKTESGRREITVYGDETEEGFAELTYVEGLGDNAEVVKFFDSLDDACREYEYQVSDEYAREETAGTCATPCCGRPWRWHSITEGNALGSQAPRRCTVCCDAIGEAMQAHRQKWVTS